MLGGCGGAELPSLSAGAGGGMLAGYGPSNAIVTSGYSETEIDPNHYKVRADGTAATPRQRVEKIATIRAAEIGVERRQKFFKIASVNHAVQCAKHAPATKGVEIKLSSYPVVELDVVYAKEATDPSFISVSESINRLSAELASELVTPDAKAAASAEIKAQCPSG